MVSPAPAPPPLRLPGGREVPVQVLAHAGEGPTAHYRIVALANLGSGQRGSGHLLAAFDGRESGEDVPDPTGLHSRRSRDGGRTWEAIRDIRPADHARRRWYTDPSLIHDPVTGRVLVAHTAASRCGVQDAAMGTDDEDPRTLGSWLGISADEGDTWTFRSLTAIAKPPPIRAAFATSGAGIAQRHAPHAGRLVQPYCGWFPASDVPGAPEDSPGEVVRSYCLFSDDHGETWTRGEPVGTDMDESTVVELSDGSILMSARTHRRGQGIRHLALSHDGARTWTPLGPSDAVPDPGNNAQLARLDPEAPTGDPRARRLLLSSTAHPTQRRRGTLHGSADDGASWHELLVFEPGACDYSVVQPLGDGAVGVLWEVESREIRFARIEAEDVLRGFGPTAT